MRLATASICAFLFCSPVIATAGQPADDKATDGQEWKIEIRPLDSTAAVSGVAATPAPQQGPEALVPAASGNLVPRMTYAQAMAAIPFNREEYEANPSYRHDSAMELMYGTLRPTMVVRQTIPYFSRYPDFFRNRFQIFPYQHSHGPAMNMFNQWNMSTFSY